MSGAAGIGSPVEVERFEELRPFPDHSAELAALVGQETGAPSLSWDAVNVPMIRHWVEAMGDDNPVYLSDEAARAAGTSQGAGPNDRMMTLLDDEGLTSVVATNCEQQYARPLVVGDRLLVRSVIESISEPKRTGLGTGRFITTRQDYVAVPDSAVPRGAGGGARASGGGGGEGAVPLSADEVRALYEAGEPVATMRFRILKYLPPRKRPARPPRPRPALTQDNAFWFEGARAHRLLIQRCSSCGTLRHPPLPACSVCGSLEWDTVEASGRGTLFSFVVVHYPQVAAFEYPLPIGLVELEEGTRVVANLRGVDASDIRIGMALQAEFVDYDEELSLPVFVPAGASAGRAGGVS